MTPISVIVQCVERIIETSVDHIVIADRLMSKEPLPFSSLLRLIEDFCKRPTSSLYLIHEEELEKYLNELIKQYFDRISKHYRSYYRDRYRQKYAKSHLHTRIEEPGWELKDKDIVLTEVKGSKDMPDRTATVANTARETVKPSCGGFDGTGDDPYAHLRYPFHVDSLIERSRVLATKGRSGTIAGSEERNPSLETRDPQGTRLSPTHSITPLDQNSHVEQEQRHSQGLDTEKEGLRSVLTPYVQPERPLEPVKSSLALEDLMTNHRPAVGRSGSPSHGNEVLNKVPGVARPGPQGTRTVSPILRYGPSNPSLVASLQMSPPPGHSVGQTLDHRANPAPSSLQTRQSRRTSWARETEPATRAFAPGLAKRKPKVDCYDPLGLTFPKQPFSMAADLIRPDVRGTWTTMDKDSNVRGFDKLWHAEKNKEVSATLGGTTDSSNVDASDTTLLSDATFYNSEGGRKSNGSKNSNSENLDNRFENPDLDVDEDVRKMFLSVKEVMVERPVPGSVRDHRNPFLRQSASSAPMTVVIGGKIAKVLKPEADRRGEFQDRFGNYIGTNLGRMKKHLIEDRQLKIRLRDEEMIEATKQKRAFEALDPKEREMALAKKRAPVWLTTGRQGAAVEDVFEFSDIPEIYLKSAAGSISARSARSTPLPHQSGTHKASSTAPGVGKRLDTSSSNREMSTSDGGDFHRIEEFEDFDLTYKDTDRLVSAKMSHHLTSTSGASNSTVKATGANTARIGTTRKSRGRRIQATVSSIDPSGTPSLIDEDPGLANIEDVEDVAGEFVPEESNVKAGVWSNLRSSSSTRGRVVSVALHDPVQFTPGAVMERIFGGIIQDAQFHPKERIALVVFVFPAEAEDFVKHVKAVKDNDQQEYRRLQIDVNWYKGSEHHAVYPLSYQIALRVIGQDARRVIGVNGIALQKKKEDVNKELNIYLGKLMVKVGLMMPNKRYVQERDGKMAIIEFASIKDAIEAMRLFKEGLIHGYRGCSVQWLRDSCDKPAVKQPWCSCATCASP